jgi:hypothetical protein
VSKNLNSGNSGNSGTSGQCALLFLRARAIETKGNPTTVATGATATNLRAITGHFAAGHAATHAANALGGLRSHAYMELFASLLCTAKFKRALFNKPLHRVATGFVAPTTARICAPYPHSPAHCFAAAGLIHIVGATTCE